MLMISFDSASFLPFRILYDLRPDSLVRQEFERDDMLPQRRFSRVDITDELHDLLLWRILWAIQAGKSSQENVE